MLNVGFLKSQSKFVLNKIWGFKKASHQFRIIFYHSIHPTSFLSHRPDQFKAHLDWLLVNGYKTIRIKDIKKIISTYTQLEKLVAITFDDGYHDNVEWAMPILEERGMVATFYVVADLIADNPKSSRNGYRLYTDRPLLTKSDLVSLTDHGMEVGSHSLTHNLATSIIKERGENYFYINELLRSKSILEEIIQNQVVSFSYPNGQKDTFSVRSGELISEAGYTTATTKMWVIVRNNSDRYMLPRCEISADDTMDEFMAKMLGKQDYRKFVCKLRNGNKNWWI